MTYRISEAALRDLNDIRSYIELDNPDAAVRTLVTFASKFEFLAGQPRAGRSRPEIASGVRSLPVGSYLVLYRIVGKSVEIARVVHGARNLPDVQV